VRRELPRFSVTTRKKENAEEETSTSSRGLQEKEKERGLAIEKWVESL